MNKQAISVTLDPSNLVWLRAQTTASGSRSIIETLDRLILEARKSGKGKSIVQSVVGSIQIAASDPDLSTADAAIRAFFPTIAYQQRRTTEDRARSQKRGSSSRSRR